MTRDEAVARVKMVLGFRQSGDAQIVQLLQEQQKKLEHSPTKPWFLLSEKEYALTTATRDKVFLPEFFLDEYEEGCLSYVDSEGKETGLVKDNYDVLSKNFKYEVTGPPQAYALTGNYFRLFPTPDAAYKIRMLYYKADEVLSSNIENKWLKWIPELLIGKAGMLQAAALRDPEAKKIFMEMISENMMLLESQNEARKHNNQDMQMGGPH